MNYMSNGLMKMFVMALLLTLAPPAPEPEAAWADNARARQIMVKVQQRDDGDNMTAHMVMTLIDRHGAKRIRNIKRFAKDFGQDTYQLIFFISPPDVKDTGFLTYDYDAPGRSDDQWLYLPALHKTKRIAGDDKSGSFMGSDFNYYDMTQRDLDDYDFNLLKEMKVHGVKTWLIESIPRTEKVVKESGYTKSALFVRQDNYVVTRAVHWLDEGNKRRYMDVKKLELVSGVWVATRTTMTAKKGKMTLHKTILSLEDVKFNQALPENLFTLRYLEKGL